MGSFDELKDQDKFWFFWDKDETLSKADLKSACNNWGIGGLPINVLNTNINDPAVQQAAGEHMASFLSDEELKALLPIAGSITEAQVANLIFGDNYTGATTQLFQVQSCMAGFKYLSDEGNVQGIINSRSGNSQIQDAAQGLASAGVQFESSESQYGAPDAGYGTPQKTNVIGGIS